MSFPGKKNYRTTVTNKLRDQIVEESKKYQEPTFLEIGCDVGYTTLTVASSFRKILALDIDSSRIVECKRNMKKSDIVCDIEFRLATIDICESSHYDVVLIDASHEYKDVKNDTRETLRKNEASTFTLFFHDYWLTKKGVRRFVDETFTKDEIQNVGENSDSMPRPGYRSGSEAVKIVITPDIRKRVLGQ